MNTKFVIRRITILGVLSLVLCGIGTAQTVFVPSGTSGIGSSSNGNVGVGTSSPQGKLDVHGSVAVTSNGDANAFSSLDIKRVNSSSFTNRGWSLYLGGAGEFTLIDTTANKVRANFDTYGMFVTNVSGAQSNRGYFLNNPDDSHWTLLSPSMGPGSYNSITQAGDHGIIYSNGTPGSGGFVIAPWSTTLGGLRMNQNGNIGIGIASPNEMLEIAGNGRAFIGDGAGASRKGLLIDAVEDGTYVRLHPYNYATSQSMNLVISPNGGGNVGIGITNPTSKLAVNGTIRAKEIIVDNAGWPDFVFEKDYVLASLPDVEAHIKAKGHLPGIPSAAEVERGGVSLGGMQVRLLAKIEELTLHLIAQEKRNSQQEAQIAELQAQVARLSSLRHP